MKEKKRSNVIWIFGDQHRAQALSCNGDPNVHTPHIDRMAVMGSNFTSAVCGFPLCCPFRGSLLTGLYPHKAVPGHEYPLDPKQKTIAHVFNEAGYDTAYFGKWHLDGFHERDGRAAKHVVLPERRGGFSRWIGFENNNSQYDCWVHGQTHSGEETPPYRLPGYETDELTHLLLEYIKDDARQNTPFFAALSVQPPHNPYIAPPEYMARYQPQEIQMRPNVPDIPGVMNIARRNLAGAYAMIENLDWNVGRVREALEKAGLTDNTHIVFFSDHGDMHGSQGMFLKTNPYEESIRVPFIIGGEKEAGYDGRRSGDIPGVPINHVDIAPTTLGLCGIDAPDWMDGHDYSYYRIRGPVPANAPDSAFIQSVIPTNHGNSIDKPWRGVISDDGWKYVCLENMDWLLFNLNNDPYEQVNLAHNIVYRDKRTKLRERLRQWIADTGDDFPVPGN